VTEETQSSLANDVRDVEQADTTQNFILGHEVVPADVQDASFVSYMQRIQFILVGLYECPGGPGLRGLGNTNMSISVFGGPAKNSG